MLRASKLDATICYFSTKIGYRQLHEVLIETTDPDFALTGLRDSSYILNSPTGEVTNDFLKRAKFLGRATGEFKKRVEDWYWLPLT